MPPFLLALCGFQMTEADLFESMQLAYSNGIASYALFVTIVGAYIVSSYLAGNKLTYTQVWIVNFLFLSTTTILTVGIWSLFNTADLFLEAIIARRSSPIELYGHGKIVTIVCVIVNIAIMIASLKFMRELRQR